MWGAIWSFLQLLPALYEIYKNLKAIYGAVDLKLFVGKLGDLASESIRIRESNLPFEEKRKARRELLSKSSDLWASSLN